MKVSIRNVDREPFIKELELSETVDSYPHLQIQYKSDAVLTLGLKPDSLVELVLTGKNLELKRGAGILLPKQMELLVAVDESLEPVQGEGKREKRKGIPFHIKIKDNTKFLYETAIDVGHYERGAFKGTYLELFRFATTIVTLMVKAGPMLDLFLNNGTILRVDGKNEERTVMSTER
jgi:hypothetical protein